MTRLSTSAPEAAKIGVVRKAGRRIAANLFVLCLHAAVAAAQGTAPSSVEPPSPSSWLRVFLTDGQVVSSVGEYARVDDMVIVTVPVGPPEAARVETRTVSLAASSVDWPRTEAYREAVRRSHFERTGGAREYAAFTDDVAATLRDVALVPDPLERIRLLEAARGRLARWPPAHHGSRAQDVAATLSLVDDLLNGLRAAAGQQTFAFTLTSTSRPVYVAPTEVLEPPPTLQDVVTQALGLARRVTDASERTDLLRSAAALLERGEGFDPAWASRAAREVHREIEKEGRIARAYGALRTWALQRTSALLARADVRGLVRMRQDIERRDARLQRQRPHEVAALLATVDLRLEDARRHRLTLERWTERQPAVRRYASEMTRYLEGITTLLRALEDVKALAGPEPTMLLRAEGQVAGGRALAGVLAVPDEARAVHGTWTSALQLAARALQVRRAAVQSGDLRQAWDGSAAAAGALLLLRQLQTDLPALTRRPAPTHVAGS